MKFHLNFDSSFIAGRIRRLIPRPLGPETKMILANALFFRGKWLYPFNRGLTFDKGLFYVTQQERSVISIAYDKKLKAL